MNNDADFLHLSLTHLKQELSVIERLLTQIHYSESLNQLKLTLNKFEGKNFRGLTNEQLITRVTEVLIKLKKLKIINTFNVNGNINEQLFIVDLNNKQSELEGYEKRLRIAIERKQIDEGLIKNSSWCKLDERNMSFTIVLFDGSPCTVSFGKSINNLMFLVLQILYNRLMDFPSDPWITKLEIQEKLKGKEIDVTFRQIKDVIVNIRNKKIRASRLEGYVNINYDDSRKSYSLFVKRSK